VAAAEGIHDGDPYHSRVGSEPEIAERLDPVVHGGLDAEGPLSREQLQAYDRAGFIELSGVFSTDELAALQVEQQLMLENPDKYRKETLILEPDSRELRSIFQVHAQSRLFGRLASDRRLVEIAMQLLGDEVYVHQSRMNYKPGLFGKEFYWHSDFETWHVEDGMPRMRALSVSITLAPNTPYNGPLMLMPGSHRRYVRCVGETPEEHYKQSLRKQEYGVPDPASLDRLYDESGVASVTGPAGSIVIFDCNTMHGSNSNISPLPRTNVFLVYNAVSNRLVRPFSGGSPRPEYIATREEMTTLLPRNQALDEVTD
jgi:ectoine hydroxylase